MDDKHLRKFGTSTDVTHSTVFHGNYEEVAHKAAPDWGKILSHSTQSSKQLESMWQDTNPIFRLYEVVPVKPTTDKNEVICLLDTTISADRSDKLKESRLVSVEVPIIDSSQIEEHNRVVSDTLHLVSEKANLLSRTVKRGQSSNKRQKLSNEEISEQLKHFR